MLKKFIITVFIIFLLVATVLGNSKAEYSKKKYVKGEKMKPEIIEQEKMLLAGVINCGKDVTEIDIHELWNNYGKSEKNISHIVPGIWYELHIGTELGNGIYCVMAGVEVKEVDDLPLEVSLKAVPAGKFAHFSHCMKDGSYGAAFKEIENWLHKNSVSCKDFSLQVYDKNFDPNDENSILHVYIPLLDVKKQNN